MDNTIHFICKNGEGISKADKNNHTLWQSGHWDVSLARVSRMIGKRIAFHETQKSNSYHGGTITAVQASEEMPGRVILFYEFDEMSRLTEPPKSWAQVVAYG